MESTLYLITARGGSKGLPRKNIKSLNGKSLILYTVEAARNVASDDDILVSTDSAEIISIVEQSGLKVPFIRPAELATDTTGHHEVIEHAVDEMKKKGCSYETVVLLQPTSPFREAKHIKEALALFDESCDMVASVKQTKDNPFFSQFIEDDKGFLVPFVERRVNRRQDCPSVFNYNGAIYIFRSNRINNARLHELDRVRGYVMDEVSSIDIDTKFDWMVAEAAIDSGLFI